MKRFLLPLLLLAGVASADPPPPYPSAFDVLRDSTRYTLTWSDSRGGWWSPNPVQPSGYDVAVDFLSGIDPGYTPDPHVVIAFNDPDSNNVQGLLGAGGLESVDENAFGFSLPAVPEPSYGFFSSDSPFAGVGLLADVMAGVAPYALLIGCAACGCLFVSKMFGVVRRWIGRRRSAA